MGAMEKTFPRKEEGWKRGDGEKRRRKKRRGNGEVVKKSGGEKGREGKREEGKERG